MVCGRLGSFPFRAGPVLSTVLACCFLSTGIGVDASVPTRENSAVEAQAWGHVERAVADGLTPIDYADVLLAVEYRHSFEHWSTASVLIDRLAAARPIDPLMAAEVRRLRAELALDEGHPAAARELFKTSGGLDRWWCSSPRSIEELSDFSTMAGFPEVTTGWRPVPGTDPLGWVRLEGLAWPARRQMLYLATTLSSDDEIPTAVHVGAAQVARVWINGTMLLTTEHPLRAAEDQVAAGAWLRRGENTLIVAVASESSDWWLRVRLTAPDGSALEGVRELDRRPEPYPPVDRPTPDIRTLEGEIRGAVGVKRTGALLALAALLIDRSSEPFESGSAREACRAARVDDPVEARLLEWMVTTKPSEERDLLTEAIDAGAPPFPARTELAQWYRDRELYFEAHDLLKGFEAIPAVAAMVLNFDVERWGAVILEGAFGKIPESSECLDVMETIADWAKTFGQWGVFERTLDRLLTLAPGLSAVRDLELERARRCGDDDSVVRLLTRRLSADPNQPGVRIALSRRLAVSDRLEEAAVIVDEGLARCPDHVDLLMERAHLQHRLGYDGLAADAARKVLELRPQNRRAERLLELLGEERSEVEGILDATELKALAADAGDVEAAAVMLLDHTALRFLPGNLTEETVQQVWLVHDGEAAGSLKRHLVPYVPETQRLRVVHARILRGEGTEINARRRDSPRLSDPDLNIYYDTRLKILSFDKLEDGDLIEITTVTTETAEANETGAYEGGIIRMGTAFQTRRTEIEISGPEDQLPAWELVNIEGKPETTTGSDGTTRLRWIFDDIAALPAETPTPPDLVIRPQLVYSNHPDWGELGGWYERHVATRIRPTRRIEALAERLTASASTRRDKIARIYAFVTNEIRYVGLEFGEHRYRPFSADWVLTHRLGDCKDTAGLLVALFRSIDIPARMVMLRTSSLGPVRAKTAVLEDFNHAIAYLPEDDLWLDGTAAGYAPFPPPGQDQGAWALVIEGPKSRPRTTPVPGAGSFDIRYTLTRAAEGRFDLRLKTVDTGEAAAIRRARFRGSQNPLLFSRWVQGQFPGARIIGEPVLDLQPNHPKASVELEATVDRSAILAGGGLKTYPGFFDLDGELAPSDTRSSPLVVPVRPDLRWSVEFVGGAAPGRLPDPVDLQTPFGSLLIEAERTGDSYRVTGRFHLEPGLVEQADAPGLRDFLVRTRRALENPLEIP